MEKSKHEYELEIQNLKQQLMGLQSENERLYDSIKFNEKAFYKNVKKLDHAYKLIEILLDKLEREGN